MSATATRNDSDTRTRVVWQEHIKTALCQHAYEIYLEPESFGLTPLEVIEKAQERELEDDERRDITTVAAVPWFMSGVNRLLAQHHAETAKTKAALAAAQAKLEAPRVITDAERAAYVLQALEEMPLHELEAVASGRASKARERKLADIEALFLRQEKIFSVAMSEIRSQFAAQQKQISAVEAAQHTRR